MRPPGSVPSPRRPGSLVRLADRVAGLPGIGEAGAKTLQRLGIETVSDLLEHLPFRYELIQAAAPIAAVDPDCERVVTVRGTVEAVGSRGSRGRPVLYAEVWDESGCCLVRWFHSTYLTGRIQRGTRLRIAGRPTEYRERLCFVNPRTTFEREPDRAKPEKVSGCLGSPGADAVGGSDESESEDSLEPVYRATERFSSRRLGVTIRRVLASTSRQIVDYVPESIRRARGLIGRSTAFEFVHRPRNPAEAETGRRRLAYDELLACQVAVQKQRLRRRKEEGAVPVVIGPALDLRIRARLPFPLTEDQNRAVRTIVRDVSNRTPMNRLLQGEVGSGKTAVAVYVTLAVVAHRRQVAVLAPTEVLAAQHFDRMKEYLEGSRVRLGLLTGPVRGPDRRMLTAGIRDGSINVVVGTHAILEDRVRFSNLGLVIIDEQHRFGVNQRRAIRAKGEQPHVLVMSATPIPRTLAMTLLGDLDITSLRELPAGRVPVTTDLFLGGRRVEAWRLVRSRLDSGEAAYIVYPRIEAEDSQQIRSVQQEWGRLKKSELSGYRVEMLHGRMKPAEKSGVLERFRKGGIDALLSTTVVEVGLDVARATVMLVEHAESYGLSQLHQLRGRVGRGKKAGYFMMLTDTTDPQVMERLRILCTCHDGFRISEHDLRMRGPGDWLGPEQHGIPTFRAANLIADGDLLRAAREDAAAVLAQDSDLKNSIHGPLREAVRTRYGVTEATA